jgi:uncharacterized protein (DUF427 family)
MKKRIPPKPGQESVWDYPRPPKLEPVSKHLRVVVDGEIIADTNQGYRVLETSHPPVYYFPPDSIRAEWMEKRTDRASYCEFKGQAAYWDLQIPGGQRIEQIAWSYPSPRQAFQPIQSYLAFYPSKVSACFVGDERARAQEGDFYGGWITSNIVGPFKGGPGTFGW